MTAEQALAKRERRVVRLLRPIARERIAYSQGRIAAHQAAILAIKLALRNGGPDQARSGVAQAELDRVAAQRVVVERAARRHALALDKRQRVEKRAPAGDVAEARRRLGLP